MSGEATKENGDRSVLARSIVEVLRREPGSTAREILAALPDEVRHGITRRDVNSVLYKGAGSTFFRSEDVKPRWRLARAPDSGTSSEVGQRVRQPPLSRHLESSPFASPPDSEDATAAQGIARILFDH
jgi:hypothetical protein